MPYQNIDAAVTAADLQAIRDAFALIASKLPFLVSLTGPERKATFKAGPDSLSFLTNAATAVRNNPTIFPPSFDRDGFLKDVDLFAVLSEIATLSDSIFSRIDDTRVAVGGEAMQGGSQVYKYVSAAAKTTPGLKPVAELLGDRFKKANSKKKESSTEPPKE
jgi:hypothetical protein